MASADAMEREAELRRLAFLQYARSQGFNPSATTSNIPQMNEAAGPIVPPAKPNAGFIDNFNNLGGVLKNTALAFVPGTKQSEDLSYLLQTNPQSIPVGMAKSLGNTVVNVADVGQVVGGVDFGEPGINYANAYRRGEGITTGVEDLLNLFAAAAAAKGAVGAAEAIGPAIRNNITNPGARFNPYEYGIHVNVPGETGFSKILPRQPGQATVVGMDSMPGQSYMWDATQPGIVEGIMRNPQMTNTGQFDILYDSRPTAYFTRAPRYRTGTDINIPASESLAVTGAQKVLEEVPLTQKALTELLARRRVMQMSEDAAGRKIFVNSAKEGIPNAVGDNNAIMAYNYIRDKIVRAQGNPNNAYSAYSPNITIQEVVNDPNLFAEMNNIAVQRIGAQAMNPPDLIRDGLLLGSEFGGPGFTEGQYRRLIQDAARLNDQGTPFKDALNQVLNEALSRKTSGEA